MTPTAALIHAAARLATDHRLGRPLDSESVVRTSALLEAPLPPDARDRARRHLAIADWLRALALHESGERADEIETYAVTQDLFAEVAIGGPRMAA